MAKLIAASTTVLTVSDAGFVVPLDAVKDHYQSELSQSLDRNNLLYYLKIRNHGDTNAAYYSHGLNVILCASDGTITKDRQTGLSVEEIPTGSEIVTETMRPSFFGNGSTAVPPTNGPFIYCLSGETTTITWALYQFDSIQLR